MRGLPHDDTPVARPDCRVVRFDAGRLFSATGGRRAVLCCHRRDRCRLRAGADAGRHGRPSAFPDRFPGQGRGGVAAGRALRDAYFAKCYHQACDAWTPQWDARGLAADTLLVYDLGLELANGRRWPQWNEGAEFGATREASDVITEGEAKNMAGSLGSIGLHSMPTVLIRSGEKHGRYCTRSRCHRGDVRSSRRQILSSNERLRFRLSLPKTSRTRGNSLHCWRTQDS